jgi:hypothetical protein
MDRSVRRIKALLIDRIAVLRRPPLTREAVAEDEAADESTTPRAMEVPVDLVQDIRELSARRDAG